VIKFSRATSRVISEQTSILSEILSSSSGKDMMGDRCLLLVSMISVFVLHGLLVGDIDHGYKRDTQVTDHIIP